MAYIVKQNRMIMRREPSSVGEYVGVGGIWDVVSSIGSGAVKVFQTTEEQKGAIAAQQALLQQQAAMNSGIDGTTLLLGGLVLAGVLYFALRK